VYLADFERMPAILYDARRRKIRKKAAPSCHKHDLKLVTATWIFATNLTKSFKATWGNLADGGRMPAILLVAVGGLHKQGRVGKTLREHLASCETTTLDSTYSKQAQLFRLVVRMF
jgi:hypothetical protein